MELLCVKLQQQQQRQQQQQHRQHVQGEAKCNTGALMSFLQGLNARARTQVTW